MNSHALALFHANNNRTRKTNDNYLPEIKTAQTQEWKHSTNPTFRDTFCKFETVKIKENAFSHENRN